jgi:hypothetical protein
MEFPAFPVLQAGIRQLFHEHPAIWAFSIDDKGQIALECWPRESASEDLCVEVMRRLLDLVDGRQEAAQWLFGRTFARVLH